MGRGEGESAGGVDLPHLLIGYLFSYLLPLGQDSAVKKMDIPNLFHKEHFHGKKDSAEFFKELKDTIKWNKAEKILDVGCGPGDMTLDVLFPTVPEDATIVATDISSEMIDYANKHFSNPRISFKLMDIQSRSIWDSWEKESFTKIYSEFLFHWLIDYRTAFENMYSLLKHGGEMYHIFFADHKLFQLKADVRKSQPWSNLIQGREYHWWYTEKSLAEREAMFSQELNESSQGFKDIQLHVFDKEYNYPSMENYLKLVISVDPYRKYIPDDLIEKYNTFLEERAQNTVLVDPESGKAKFSYKLFTLKAKKL